MNKVEVVVNSQHLSVLLGKDMNLHIPSYQRGYCWEKKQVESLLESLWAANRDMKYHLGTIILHKYGKVHNVVDGQQRLLTLSILMHCLNKENLLNKDEYKKIAEDNPLLKCKTSDLDVIKHVFNNSETISNWIACHPVLLLPSIDFLLKKLVFTVVTISRENTATDTKSDSDEDKVSPQTDPSTKDEYDSSLPLAWTFFNAVNSGGKSLSDFDLLKAHHLRYLSTIYDDDLIQYKAGKWDSNGEQTLFTFRNEKTNLFEASLSHTFYLIRSWLKNRHIEVSELPADSQYCILHHYSALQAFLGAEESMMGLTSGVVGGKHFFDWTEYWIGQFTLFCNNPIVKKLNMVQWKQQQLHLRIIAQALLFYYFSKFGDIYLADACIFILYRIGRLRNTTAKNRNNWYGNGDSNSERCVPHTIVALEESPSPEYFFAYCSSPSNRYVRHYKFTERKENEESKEWLRSDNLGPNWWKNFLMFAASKIQSSNSNCSTQENKNTERIPFPSCNTPQIGDSICYKKQIAELLNEVASAFTWKYNTETLELSFIQ